MTTTPQTDQLYHARCNAKAWYESIQDLVTRLEIAQKQAVDGPDETGAPLTEIHESALSVMVRDGWREPGQTFAEDGAEEYEVLLSTGGPALRIYGKIGKYDEPETAELQMQEWGTPWTYYPAEEETLLAFVRNFYFGG